MTKIVIKEESEDAAKAHKALQDTIQIKEELLESLTLISGVKDGVNEFIQSYPIHYYDFENVTQGSYADFSIKARGLELELRNALIGTLSNDLKNGLKSLRLGTTVGRLVSSSIFSCGEVSFYAGIFGNDSAAELGVRVYKSADNQIISQQTIALLAGVFTKFTFHINETDVYLRFDNQSNSRINIDDLAVTARLI